jgi:D-alanyl-D-alanine dipeptidase
MILLMIREKRNFRCERKFMKRVNKNKIISVLLIAISLVTAGCNRDIQTITPNLDVKNQEIEAVKVEEHKEEIVQASKPEVKSEIKQEEKKAVKEISGLVKVQDLDSSIVADLRYATENNFTGKKIYPVNVCVLRKETVEKLVKANEELKKNGLSIKIWDAYRPPYVQQIFWDMVQDSRFVADPKNGGSNHNKGTAVDITLIDSNGKEIAMPTKFDDFSVKAHRDNPNLSKDIRKNVDLLTNIMKKHGFAPLKTEWWHFNDSDSSKYKIVDVKLEKFIN